MVTEMRTGKQVTICRGAMPIIGSNDAIEITFDDGSLNPYRIFLDLRQFDRLPGEEDHNRDDLRLAVYIKGPQKLLDIPAKYVNEFQEGQRSGD